MHKVRQIESAYLHPDQMKPGDGFGFTFDKPGTFLYQCTFHHPTMDGVSLWRNHDRQFSVAGFALAGEHGWREVECDYGV